MKVYRVSYSGNSSRFRNFSVEVDAKTEREAVEKVFKSVMYDNYFPQEDGTILDCDGEEIASPKDTSIDYDGGCFSADEVVISIDKTRWLYNANSVLLFRRCR